MGIWPFGSKADTIRKSGLLDGSTDWHSHILPGVDDGVKTMEESLEILAIMEQLGVKRLWFTPHVMEDYPNETKDLRKRYEELKLAYSGNIELFLASENMLDSLFEERLDKNDFLTLGETGNHLLVETSYYNPPMNMVGMLERLKKAGYYPVLAHPERYQYMDEKDYKRLKDMDILFQANYFSLIGAYGNTAQKKLEWMLKKGMIDMMGSDLHRISAIQNLVERSPRKNTFLDSMKEVKAKNNKL